MESLPLMLLVAAVGLLAGLVNVSAGGGSLLTVPLLIFLGLEGPVANGTNRVALIAQNVVAIGTFRKGGVSEWPRAARLALAALPGAAAGALLGVTIGDELFRRVLGVALLVAIVFILRGPRAAGPGGEASPTPRAITVAAFARIGLYSGFLQAGVGFLIIFLLVSLDGLDLLRTNAAKVTIILLMQVVALAIFAGGGKVRWAPGLVLALGNMLGGWIGVRLSLRAGERYLRPALALCVVAFALKLIVFP